MKYEIVEIKENLYAIRRRNIFERIFNLSGDFLDTRHMGMYWSGLYFKKYFSDCTTNDIDELRDIINALVIKNYKVIE